VAAGPGVACPKSRSSGCEPAALETEPFPGCPPGLLAAARRVSACRRAKMAFSSVFGWLNRLRISVSSRLARLAEQMLNQPLRLGRLTWSRQDRAAL